MVTTNTTAPAPIDFASMNEEQLRAALLKQQEENKSLATALQNAKKAGTFSVKVNPPGVDAKDKTKATGGNISIYGLGRFPITLYLSQALTMFSPANVLSVLEAAAAGLTHLSVKGDTEAERAAKRAEEAKQLKELIVAYRSLVAKK